MTSLSGNSSGTVFINDTGNSTLLDSNVATLTRVNASIANDAQVANSWTKFTNGQLNVQGGTYSLAGLTDVDGSNLIVSNGGSLALPGLINYTANDNTFQANGTGSVLDVSALTTPTLNGNWSLQAINGGTLKLTGLTSLSGNNSGTVFITDTGNSTLMDSNVTTLSSVNANIANDAQVANSWTKFTNGQLNVQGGSYSLAGLTDVDGSNLIVSNGGSLALSGLVSYAANGNTFQANGTGSVLDVSALTTPTLNGNWSLQAINGGTLKLTVLTSLSSSSTGSVFIGDTGGSTLLDSNVATLSGVNATIANDAQVANSWTKFTNGQLSVTGGSYSLAGLTDVDGSNLVVSNGGTLALSGLVSYTSNGNTFQANGTGSVLDVSALTTPTLNGNWSLQTINGGTLKLTGLTSLSGNNSGTVFIDDTGNSMLVDSNVTTLTKVDANIANDAQVANSWTKFTNGQLSVEGGAYSLAGLTDVDGSNLLASNGGSLALSGLVSYTSNGNTFQANGAGSVLDVSKLKTVTQQSSWNINALNGGVVKLSGLTSVTSTNGINFDMSGTGSTIDLSNLTSLTGPSSFSITNGATLNLPVFTTGNVTLGNGSQITIQGVVVSMPADGTSGATINVPSSQGLTITLQNTGTLTGTIINVGQGSKVNLSGGKWLGTTTFNVAQGATVDLTGGGTTTYGGTLTGSGSGTVMFTGGNLSPAVGGLTFNFPGSLFQWTGGGIFGAVGNTTNRGTINLAGSNDKGFYEDATLFNYGTLIQTGTGNLGLHSDNISPTTFINEAGASYLIESDSGIDNPFGGQVAVQNAGTIKKTAGTGTSTLNINGVLSNTGTIEADSGTLNLEPNTIAQLGSTAVSFAGPITTNIYSGHGTTGSGAPYSGLVGTLTTNSIQFGSSTDFNWHPFKLSAFGADSTGSLNVATAGTYTFELNSDDGSRLYIDGNLVIDDGGGHAAGVVTGKATLTARLHTFEVQFFEDFGGGSGLDMDPPIDTLTGGTWKAQGGATIEFPSGTSVAYNDANVSLDGSGANITALAGLNSNKGNLGLTGGANFATAGDLTNSGSLTVGAGSTLTIKGNYTQTASGALNVQVGGTPASGSFGQVAVQSAANLGGNFNVSLVNGFAPSSGQDFKVMPYASASGSFSTLTGLSPFFTAQVNPTSLDLADVGTNAVSLQLSNVTAPTTATTGQQITVNWQVNNNSNTAATGSWQDSVYLSTTPTVTGSSILLGSVTHTGGLAANGMYNSSLSANVPVLPTGNYYVLVQTDSLYQVPQTSRASNIAAASTGQLAVSVPAVTLGTPSQGTFTSANQDQYYQVTVPAGGTLQVTLTSAASSGALALYVSQGTQPTTFSYLAAGNLAGQPNQSLTVPTTAAGTYYILVHSVYGAAATAGYTLTVTQSNALSVTAISSYSGGNAGNATVEIDGTNFTPQTTARLTLGSTSINASSVEFVNASKLFATFNLSGAAAGGYTLSVQQGSQSATAAKTFQVVAATANNGMLDISIGMPQLVRAGRTATVTITYTNKTANDIIAPLLEISSENLGVKSRPAAAAPAAEPMASTTLTPGIFFSTPDDPNNFVQQAELLAVAPDGPAGILRPGQSGQLTLTLLTNGTGGTKIPVAVQQVLPGQAIDWASQKAMLQPVGASNAAWNVIFNNLTAMVGTTTDSFRSALGQAATYLSSLGETPAQVSNVSRLWSFLVAQANDSFPTAALSTAIDAILPVPGSLPLSIGRTFSSTLSGRYQAGIFGMGWTTPLQTSLSTDGAGNVTINTGGVQAFFFAQANGTYSGTGGVQGTLTKSGGVFTYTDPTGMQYVFQSNGNVNYEQDTNGNRITSGYNAQNQLTSLTYSNVSGTAQPTQQLTLTYNAQGLVSQAADGTGNSWAYSYDSTGHLLSVTAPGNLTTSYTYDTGSDSETANALLSITNPNGAQVNYTYDPATGRLTGITHNGGANPITYTYPGEGEVTSTDVAGNTSTVWFSDFGTARVQDGRGNITNYTYDANGHLIRSTDAAGGTYQYSYDANGNLVQTVDPLGQTVQMTYGPLRNLTSITDAAGNTKQYKYDSAGNLLSITYPDNTQKSFTYDPVGNLSETVLQNGDPINYQYNAQGLVSLASFADGTSQSFTYDSHGNMLTANSYGSGGALTGTTTLTYNAANQLLSVTYPNGQSLTFTYNAQGQRIKSVDQSGFTINYSYDEQGRLSKLTDGSGNLIVQYTYNNVGQLGKKVNGNGTNTTYQYDANGNLQNEVNFADASGKTVNSSFTYTYNSLDERTSVTDAVGNVTKYGYDALGQLTQVMLPNGTNITYVYNAAGDRTQFVTNGTPTSYTSNSNNEITQAGSTSYTYDANGNLKTATNASGTTTYTYNDLNQLVSITNPDGSVQTFQYNPLGFLVGMTTTSGGTTSQTNFLVDPTGLGNVVASYNGSGSLIADYTYGLGLVSQTGPSGTGYYDFDGSGNTVGITGSNDSYVNQYSYLPFGETTTVSATLPNLFTFAGQAGVMQIGAGLFYMRARDYAPTIGQFLSNDPLGLAAGDTNVRRYAGNNPVSFADPSGLQPANSTSTSGWGNAFNNNANKSNYDWMMNHNNYDPSAYHGDSGGQQGGGQQGGGQQGGGQQGGGQHGGQGFPSDGQPTGNRGGFGAYHNPDGSWDLYPIDPRTGKWDPNGPHIHIPPPDS